MDYVINSTIDKIKTKFCIYTTFSLQRYMPPKLSMLKKNGSVIDSQHQPGCHFILNSLDNKSAGRIFAVIWTIQYIAIFGFKLIIVIFIVTFTLCFIVNTFNAIRVINVVLWMWNA